MPLTATHEQVKTYQEKVEKGKVTSDGLDPCPQCNLEPGHFKIHAFRERRFLIIVEMLDALALKRSGFCNLGGYLSTCRKRGVSSSHALGCLMENCRIFYCKSRIANIFAEWLPSRALSQK